MNILHIDPYTTNSVSTDLAAVSIGDTVDTAKSIADYTGYEVIVLGSNEGGLISLKSILKDIVDAHMSGIGILFMHDIVCRNEADVCSYTNEACELDLIHDTFLDDLKQFGVVGFTDNYNYRIYDRVDVLDSKHTILNSPNQLSTLSYITPTHNSGIILDPNCKVISIESGAKNNLTDFHIALYEDVYGKVVHYSGGHNSYGKSYEVTLEEQLLLANMVDYIKKI